MSVPVYLAGNTPFFLLGLERILMENPTYHLSGRFLLRDVQLRELMAKVPSLLLLHLGENHRSNIQYCKQLLARAPASRIVVFCKDETSKKVKTFFTAGVKGYALPTICPEELSKAMIAMDTNEVYLDPRISASWANQRLGLCNRGVSLTRREQEVLQLIVNEYTTKEIAEKLFISSCTAETHRLNIMHKLGVRNTAGLVREALRQELYS